VVVGVVGGCGAGWDSVGGVVDRGCYLLSSSSLSSSFSAFSSYLSSSWGLGSVAHIPLSSFHGLGVGGDGSVAWWSRWCLGRGG